MTSTPTNLDPDLPGDLEDFLEKCELQEIVTVPLDRVSEMEFPVRGRKAEHQALSSLVARMLRIERLVSRHTADLSTLDEQDLIRGQLDPGLREWRDTVGQAAIVRLALLDCRERLPRLLQLAEEERRLRVLERLSVPRLREEPEDLGAMEAVAVWLLSELRAISSLADQVKELPTKLLPQPAWQHYLELRELSPQLGAAIERCDVLRDEDARSCHAYLEKQQALEEALGGLPEYDGLLDFADWELGAFSPASSLMYERVRKVLGDALACLSEDQIDAIASSFPSMQSLTETIEVADRLTDRGNALWEFMNTEIFRPEDWKANRDALKPLLLKQPQHVRHEIRSLLMEVAHSFVLGQWAAVAALSRAALERVVKVNWVSLGFAIKDASGKVKYPNLETMIDDVGKHFPGLVGDMDIVRRYGNNVLHESRSNKSGAGDRASQMAQMRRDALESIESLYRSLAGLPKLAK